MPFNPSLTPNEPQINQTEQSTLHQNCDREEDDTDDELSQKTLSQLSIHNNLNELVNEDPVTSRQNERAESPKKTSRDNDERLKTTKENEKAKSSRKRRHEKSETSEDDEIAKIDFSSRFFLFYFRLDQIII